QRLADMWESKMRLFFQTFLTKQKKGWVAAAGIDVVQRAAVLGALLGAMAYAIVRIQEGSLTAGTFVTVYFLVMQVRTMAESIFRSAKEMRGYRAQEDRMRFLLEKREQKEAALVPEWQCLSGRQLSYQYAGQESATEPVDFMLKRGEFVHLKGENGSGKTTLLRILCGLFPSKSGEVYLDKKRLDEVDSAAWRSKIAYMQQFPDIFVGSVKENVRIGNLDLTEEELDQILEQTGLSQLADREVCGMSGELSGGEVKRIEAARMLARMKQAELLIFDEPFEQLDESGRRLIEGWLKDERKSRILVTHAAGK
ncbi:MAG: ABC transporter ATP-binding protein/permease, partial [Lachnospiraceae bacterium]|nr:ABC transporter ATP-binding protein/permease [Lachnospiraceae bacterium]